MPLLTSKMRPPVLNVQSIARHDLHDLLDNCRDRFLTIVRSPAGYGKTTLLVQWWSAMKAAGAQVAWLSLDEDDRDPDMFVAYLANMLTEAGHTPTQQVMQQVRSTEPTDAPTLATVTALLNALDEEGPPLFLILDDYHLAESRQLDQLMERITRYPLRRLRIILATRTRPGFPVSRLRAQGSLLEITERELRFDMDDVAALFGEAVSRPELEVLSERTEGWPVALQLARIWIERQTGAQSFITAFSGTAGEMAGYLADQVVAGLPDAYRDVLLATSILDEVTGDLADHLTCSTGSGEVLVDLVRLNAPVFPVISPNSEQAGAYRYHPIFREFLSAQLELRGQDAVQALHRRAMDWFTDRKIRVSAIHHAMAAGDVERACRIAEEVSWVHQVMSGRLSDLRRVFRILPRETALQRPRLALAQAYLHFKNGENAAGSDMFFHARNMIVPEGRPLTVRPPRNSVEQDLILLEALHAAYRDYGISAETIQSVERILSDADPTDFAFRALINNILGVLYYRNGSLLVAQATLVASLDDFERAGFTYGRTFIHIHLVMVALTRGRLAEAASWLRQPGGLMQRPYSNDEALNHRLGLFEAEMLYLQNRTEDANDILFEALPDVENAEGWPELFISAYRTAASIAFNDRGLAAADEVLESAQKLASRLDYPRLGLNLISKRVTLLVQAGRIDEAEDLARTHDFAAIANGDGVHDISWREREDASTNLARLALARGLPAKADALLTKLEARCRAGDYGRRLIQIRILRALACRASDDMDGAVRHIKQALTEARVDHLIRLFLDEGREVRDLLKAAVVKIGVAGLTEAMYEWISEILIAFDDGPEGSDSAAGHIVLTPRELDILQNLRLGGSNKEIARRLDTTDNAVKFHMKNIFRKLGVNTRQLAVALAEKRGLLDTPQGLTSAVAQNESGRL